MFYCNVTNPQRISLSLSLTITVLQDSATDSEEIIYPIRAASSCSAPPDLLMTTTGPGQDQTDYRAHKHNLVAAAVTASAATTTNCHNSPVTTNSSNSSGNNANGDPNYQIHRRMRQKLMEQRQARVSAAAAASATKETAEVATGELVRLEVRLRHTRAFCL